MGIKIILSVYNIGPILPIITIILFRFIQASKETVLLKTHHPTVLSAASFVDESILRRKRLEANVAAVRHHLQQQRDVQVENVGGLLGPLPSINTINDLSGRQSPNNLQPILAEQQNQQQSVIAPTIPSAFSALPPASTPPIGYQLQQQSTEIYARLGQNQQTSVSTAEENYQTLAPSITPISTDTIVPSSGYENLETPPTQQINRTKRIIRSTAQKQSPALLRCLQEAALFDSIAQNPQAPLAPPVRAKAQAPSHRINVDILPLKKSINVLNNRVFGHRNHQIDSEYSSGPPHPPSIHPPPSVHRPNVRPSGGQFFVPASTQGGADFQHPQQFLPPPSQHVTKFSHGGTNPQEAGSFSGSTKNSNLPSMISIGGQKGHMPSISSFNLPPSTNAHRYYYPPRIPLPLPTCFHNPTGYPCCNPKLNDLIVETYTSLESKPRFHTCNINAIAQHLQIRAETRFNTSFETVAAFDDFAQKIHFAGDLVCKVELGGKYMLAYATVKDVSKVLTAETGDQQQQQEGNGGHEEAAGTLAGRRKKRQIEINNSVYGPELPKPFNDLSRHYSMWV